MRVSLSNKQWNLLEEDCIPKSGQELFDILVRHRNIGNLPAFLNCTVKDNIPDPMSFKDMKQAVDRIVRAILEKQPIAVLGDYDVDGISSVSLFLKFLKEIGVDCAYFIPDRLVDGYGISKRSIEMFKDRLLIAVDCGASAFDEIAYASSIGADLIVIDHHTMESIPEGAVAIVNAHRPDESGGYTYLCAAGMVFMCLVALNSSLKKLGFYSNRAPVNLLEYLDIVALATVCDVVPLVNLNRAFVSTGLKVIQCGKNCGIRALLSVCSATTANAETIAFLLGPRLNAPGRIADGKIGVELLLADNSIKANEIANKLHELNAERQEIEQQVVEEASAMVDENLSFICLDSPDWHAGVVGIVAGRLKEKYNKLSIVIAHDDNGVGKASCRSVPNVNIADVIRKGIAQGVLLGGGGHAIAAGFSVELSKLKELHEFLVAEIPHYDEPCVLTADCELNLDVVDFDLIQSINALEPCGAQNPKPSFIFRDLCVVNSRVVGGKHISVTFEDRIGNKLRAIAFKCVDTAVGNAISTVSNQLDVLGALNVSSWNGQSYINLYIEDVAYSVCN